jgi:hypothetical protein
MSAAEPDIGNEVWEAGDEAPRLRRRSSSAWTALPGRSMYCSRSPARRRWILPQFPC